MTNELLYFRTTSDSVKLSSIGKRHNLKKSNEMNMLLRHAMRGVIPTSQFDPLKGLMKVDKFTKYIIFRIKCYCFYLYLSLK